MPLYEYQCDACSRRFEVIQKFSDAPVDICPTCGGSVKRLLSSPAFHFKGSGWYVTDYARAGKTDSDKPSPEKSDGKSGGTTGAGTSESESKPASESKGSSPPPAKPSE